MVGEGIETAVVELRKALEIAKNAGLDLVEISPNVTPPVCKVMDYRKFLYEQKRKQKEIKAKTAKVVVKEIKLSPNISEHDFDFKVNHAIRFLKDGCQVKVTIFFRGRTVLYADQGELSMLKFAQAVMEYGKTDKLPQKQDRRMVMTLVPKK